MPIKKNIGYSETTPLKQQIFRDFLHLHITLWDAITNKHIYYDSFYYYLDLTAGTGTNPKDMSLGSPLIFLGAATGRDIPFEAALLERNIANYEELCLAVSPYTTNQGSIEKDNIYVQHIDHAELLNNPNLWAAYNQLGLAYYDPNNLAVKDGESKSFNSIVELFNQQEFLRVDFLASVFATNIKRIRRFTGKCMSDWLSLIPKKHWLVRRPLDSDAKKWTMFFGTNWVDFPQYKRLEFYSIHSTIGRQILEELNYTKEECAAMGIEKLRKRKKKKEMHQLNLLGEC